MESKTHRGNGLGVLGIEEPGVFCSATTLAGKRCRGIPLQGEGLCFAHSVKLADKRRAAQVAGGKAISERRRVLVGIVNFETPETVRAFCEGLARTVLKDDVKPAKALAVCQIAEAALRMRRTEEDEELLRRVERLEAQADAEVGSGDEG